MAELRHFLNLRDVSSQDLQEIVDVAMALKVNDERRPLLANRTLAMIFSKPSTRTRVSFEVAIRHLGGHAAVMMMDSMQTSRGETIGDTARVMSRYVDAIMIRTDDPKKLEEMAEHSSVPVINGLTNRDHPCQLMADVMTLKEHRGPVTEQVVAWSGDGNNMANSWIEAAARFGFELRLGCPAELPPDPDVLTWARREGARVTVCDDPVVAVRDVDCVVTDCWVSMGQKESEKRRRHNLLQPYQVNEALMAKAKDDAVFMHCLPAHRGEEVTAGVLEGPQSLVWDEAENRLHTQKAVLLWCFHILQEAAPGI